MPTMITIPIGQRTKSIQFGAAYSPSMSFNPNQKLLSGCSGILSGMGITVNTVPDPDQVTVDVGAFIQRGIIVNVAAAQIVEAPPLPTFPLFLVAENANEVHNSSVQYLFTTTPAADSCIIATWTAGPMNSPDPAEVRMSLCGLKEAINGVTSLVIQDERLVAVATQTIFNLPGAKAYVLGSNKLFVYRNGKKLEPSIDYSEDTPTQFTLNFGATAGDIFDIIVFQGAPSITGLALLNLTDVTTNLANAIKDVSTLRAALATAANPLSTIADINAAIAAAILLLPGPTKYTEIEDFASGTFGSGAVFPAFALIPSPVGAFVQGGVAPADVVVSVSGTSIWGAAFHDGSILGISLDAGPIRVAAATTNSGLGDGRGVVLSSTLKFPAVAPGAHTFHLHLSIGFGLAAANIMRTAEAPLRMVISHR